MVGSLDEGLRMDGRIDLQCFKVQGRVIQTCKTSNCWALQPSILLVQPEQGSDDPTGSFGQGRVWQEPFCTLSLTQESSNHG